MIRRQVLFVLPDLGLGGAQVVAARLTSSFRDRGDDVVIATLGPTSNDHVPVPEGVRRVSVEPTEGRPGPLGVLVKNLRRRRSFRQIVGEWRPDVVIAFVDSTNLFTLLATVGLTVPVIVSERVDPRKHRIAFAQRTLRRVLYRRAAALVVQTERIAEWGRSVVLRERVSVIPNPVVVPTIPAAGSTPPLVVAAGRLVEQKGFDLLLRALAGLDARTLAEWRTVILGEGPMRAELEALIAQLDLGGHARLVGQVPSADEWLQRGSIFVLSSRFEGFPNVLAEAMAWGLPVLAFDCATGPRELVQDGVNGRLLPEADVLALTAGLRDLMRSPDDRRRLGSAARSTMRDYSVEAVADLWDALVEEVTSHVRDRRRR